MIEWDIYPHFTKDEFDCSETGENEMTHEALLLFERIRAIYGYPMGVSSGFRSLSHSKEKDKKLPGSHPQGTAGDFHIPSQHRFLFVKASIECGAAGIGIAKTFIHVDAGHAHMARPALWSY